MTLKFNLSEFFTHHNNTDTENIIVPKNISDLPAIITSIIVKMNPKAANITNDSQTVLLKCLSCHEWNILMWKMADPWTKSSYNILMGM